MTRPAIIVDGLGKRFGSTHAVAEVSLSVPRGSVLGLVGPNGAGKTTLVRILSTLLRPDRGRAEVAGHDVVRDAPALREVIGLAGQYAAVDDNLTGRENLLMVGMLYHLGLAEARRRAEEALERLDLVAAAGRQVKTYSGGMRRRLDLGASLIARPAVLFLDEPTTGLDPRGRLALWESLRDLVADGTTLLMTTQYLEEADRLADRVAVIDRGRVIAQGTPDALKSLVGGERLELQVADASQLTTALAALRGPDLGEAQVTGGTLVVLPIRESAASLAGIVRRLGDAGVEIRDLAVRRPTLDDVFLSLTGSDGARPDAAGPAGPAPESTAPSAPATPEPRHRRRQLSRLAAGADLVSDTLVMTWRNLLAYLRVPELLLFSTIQPVVVVIFFSQTFGGAIRTPGGRYIDYLIPGMMVQAAGHGGHQCGVMLASDLARGMMDRFRSLPMSRAAVLVGRVLADALSKVLAIVMMVAVGALLGFRFHAGAFAAVGAVALVLLAGVAFSWVAVPIGLTVRNVETAESTEFLWLLPLVVVSTTFVPLDVMAPWLRPFAAANPVSVMGTAVRALCTGGETLAPVLAALGWIVLIHLMFLPLTIRTFRRIQR